MFRNTFLVAAAFVALTTSAQAGVQFALTDQVYSFLKPQGSRIGLFPLTFEVSYETVNSGAFHIRSDGPNGGSNPVYLGDTAGFINLLPPYSPITSKYLFGTLYSLSATFTLTGEISSFAADFITIDDSARISGTDLTGLGRVSGDIGQDNPQSCGSPLGTDCSLSARMVRLTPSPPQNVPEPMSLALLGMGLVGMAALRRMT